MAYQNESFIYKIFRPHQLEGQKKRRQFDTFHLDAQKHSAFLKEASLSELVKKMKTGVRISASTSSMYDDMAHDGQKSSLVTRLISKYLRLRCPLLTRIQRRSTVFILSILISSFRDSKTQDFEPENLWKLMKAPSIMHSWSYISAAYVDFKIRNGPLRDQERDSINVAYISFFGEFLYSISTLYTDSDSPMVSVRMDATEGERLLIDEIANTVTSKLGILTYIVLRNCAACKSRKFYRFVDDRRMFSKIFPSIHESFKRSAKKVRQIPILSDFFSMFQRFICLEICKSRHLFRDDFGPLDVDFLNFLEVGSNVEMRGSEDYIASLVFVLRDVSDIFLAIYNQHFDFNFKLFKYLPKYIESYSMTKSIETEKATIFMEDETYRCVESVLLAVSLLLDFLFVENWMSDVTNDYVTICKELKLTLEAKCDGISHIVREAALFPFM